VSAVELTFVCMVGLVGFCCLLLCIAWIVDDIVEADRAATLVSEIESFLAQQETPR
jgi:hypothetical protein